MSVSQNEQKQLNNFQKQIYNSYLKALACKAGRPYTPRKDFSDIQDEIYTAILKLESLFLRNPEINMDYYFRAGLDAEDIRTITTFVRPVYLKHYVRYMVKRDGLSPDSESVQKDFVEGFKFIISFLKEHNLKLDDYPIAVNDSGIPWYLIHLKQRKILMYHLHHFNISPPQMGDELLNIYTSDFRQKFSDTWRSFKNSTKLKSISENIKQLENKKYVKRIN